jgi:dolichyl-phosphate beta-glucosyltransferase
MEESVGVIIASASRLAADVDIGPDPTAGLKPDGRASVATASATVRVPWAAGSGPQPNLPAGLLRAQCVLEILIPSLNEALRLPATLTRTIEYLEAQTYSSSIVVVDNGSIDRTVDVATAVSSRNVPVTVIGCAQPGKGAAVRRGIRTSRAQYVGFMDADLATPIETLDVVVPLLENGCQAVVGSRRAEGAVLAERQPFLRTMGGMAFRAMVNQVVRGITDTQCGFKFFAGDLARSVAQTLSIDGFAFDIELLSAIAQQGVSITEVPVVWSNQKGSTLRAGTDGARAVADVLRLARRAPAS